MADQDTPNNAAPLANPMDPTDSLHPAQHAPNNSHPDAQPITPQDSATTRAEKVERNGLAPTEPPHAPQVSDTPQAPLAAVESGTKRKLSDAADTNGASSHDLPPRKKGIAAIKAEFLIPITASRRAPEADANAPDPSSNGATAPAPPPVDARDAAAADPRSRDQDGQAEAGGKKKKHKKQKGQNTNRDYGSSRDAIQLCLSRARTNEFSPAECPFGQKCKYEHDIRHYLAQGKRADLDTFGGVCPVYEARGRCTAGWRCRFATGHMKEVEHPDGRKELVLLEDTEKLAKQGDIDPNDDGVGVANVVEASKKIGLRKRQIGTPKSDNYLQWMRDAFEDGDEERGKSSATMTKEAAASYYETKLLPSEKRRLYYGPETPVLAPLTTQGNLPFRRLAIDLGAQLTWSEMAMGLPLIQGEKAEWALIKAHQSELTRPNFAPATPLPPTDSYDHASDIKFGVQIAANKPWLATKTTEILTAYCPHLRAVDLNVGCPIDLVFRTGAGSALMDSPGRLEKILRGMNSTSGAVPITVKIRMGVRDDKPTADRLMDRLAWGGPEAQELGIGPPGVQAITLHGRSRQQRYTRSADWSYIAECSALIKRYNAEHARRTDTVREADARYTTPANNGRIYFAGNGDCYSHVDYYTHLAEAQVDSVMIGRGALIKPWIFEEIGAQQLLDKSASERLTYIERFARYGLQTWGSDEIGVGTTRRFLLEWLSFACRYVPVGLLEHLPPAINDRPPAYRGRSDLETLLSSDNYKDWIRISEMFLGPAHKDFRFEPKHRSNAYESIEAEG